jgi:hypothetical protein
MEFRFFAEHLSPGERLGEILFGLIMTLTFTIGAGFWIGTEEGASAELLIATIGCNVAWGVIDGALIVLGRVFDRSRLARLGRAIAAHPREDDAVRLVADELDETLGGITSEARRIELYRDIVARVKSGGEPRPLLGRKDVFAAIAVFCSVMVANFPAVLPYFVIDDPWLALRASNALLILMLFWVGYKWAGYTTIKPWVAASSLTGLGVFLVALAIRLGG